MQVAFYGKVHKGIRTIVNGWMVGLFVHFNGLFKCVNTVFVEFIRVDIVGCNSFPCVPYHFGFEICSIPTHTMFTNKIIATNENKITTNYYTYVEILTCISISLRTTIIYTKSYQQFLIRLTTQGNKTMYVTPINTYVKM